MARTGRPGICTFVPQRLPIVTTSFILLECGNAAARRPYRSKVVALRKALAERNELITPNEEDVEQAWAAYERGEAGRAGIVDHISFVVMQRLEIRQAFTNLSLRNLI